MSVAYLMPEPDLEEHTSVIRQAILRANLSHYDNYLVYEALEGLIGNVRACRDQLKAVLQAVSEHGSDLTKLAVSCALLGRDPEELET